MDFDDYLEKIDIIDNYKLKNIKPTLPELTKIYCYLIKFIKDNKLIIFGGLAINKALPKEDKIYQWDEDSLPDIDVYSDDARTDIIKMSNMLHEKGIKNIVAKDGVINNLNNVLLLSYNIYIQGTFGQKEVMNCININSKIYNKIPKKLYNGIYFVAPEYQKIDILLSLTNSITAYNRWEKDTTRYDLLNKYHPYQKSRKNPNTRYSKIDIKEYLKPLCNQKDVIIGGTIEYAFMILESKLKDFNNPDIICLEIYTIDTKKYLEIYSKIINNCKIKLYNTYTTILPQKYVIFENNIPRVIIYDIEKRPTQYQKYKEYNILSYDMLLLTLICDFYMNKVIAEPKKDMIYYLELGRKKYFKDNKKTLFDNTIFKSYVIECIGDYQNMQFKFKVDRKKTYQAFKYSPNKVKTLLKTSNQKKYHYREKVGEFMKNIKL